MKQLFLSKSVKDLGMKSLLNLRNKLLCVFLLIAHSYSYGHLHEIRLFQPKRITVIGKIEPQSLVSVFTFNSFFTGFRILYFKATDNNGYFHQYISIRNTCIININRIQIYVSPGDSIFIHLDSLNSYSISGNNGPQQNFLNLFEKKFGPLVLTSFDTLYFHDILNYKRKISESYKAEVKFYTLYIKEHPGLTDKFKKFAYNEIFYNYLMNIYMPYMIAWINPRHIIPENYLEGIGVTPNVFNHDNLMISRVYTLAALYFDDYLAYNKRMGLPENRFLEKYRIINKNFSGPIRDYLLMDLMNKNVKDNFKCYDSIYALYQSDCLNSSYKKYIDSQYRRYKHINKLVTNPLSLDLILKTKQGSNTTWGNILNKNRGRIIYIDFWASWCAPCRTQIPYSIALEKKYSSQGVSFVYISLDSKEGPWLTAIQRLFSNSFTQQYLLPNQFNSPLCKELGINMIPHYIIINKNGKIFNDDAPRPSNPYTKVLLEKLIKNE